MANPITEFILVGRFDIDAVIIGRFDIDAILVGLLIKCD